MRCALAAACWLLIGASEPDTLVGTVQVTHGAVDALVSLAVADAPKSTRIGGDLAPELRALAGTKVEVAGVRDGETFIVRAYRILDLGGGARPDAIGQLVETATGYAIVDGDGSPIPLSLAPKMQARMQKYLLGKVWVRGSRLLSGEIKVTMFGVLREPPVRARKTGDGADADTGGDAVHRSAPGGPT